MARTAAPAEQQALTTTALALAVLAATLLPAPALAAVTTAILAQYAVLALAGTALRLDLPQLIAGHHHTLRAIAAGSLLTLAATLRALATAALWVLTTSAHHIAPNHSPTTR
ncbi:hypothetical protein ACGFZP_13160 [Kitasatospora sp. NPDC048239]|uniref:hypothetical protein n=1 Tax=Kitasatospora sp. NPDC048239 TaxID=3364046 RepID=UPI0037238447